MSEKLCAIRKRGGGGALTETALWTNASPTSSFAAQNVTLSSGISNFEVIRVYYLCSTTEYYVDFPKDLIVAAFAEINAPLFVIGKTGTGGTSLFFVRVLRYVSNTSISIGANTRVGASGTANEGNVPTKICGLK